jgi:GntR family transcriptional regulator
MFIRESSVPMYQQISEAIQKKIVEGVYKKGTKIPTEQELMDQYNVSRTTVRLAVTDILDKGLIEKKQGKGTFVCNTPVSQQLDGFKGLYETLIESGIVPETRLLEYEVGEATESIYKALHLPVGEPIKRIVRMAHVNENPIVLAQISLHPEVSDLITLEEAKENPIHLTLEKKLGVPIRKAHFEISAENSSRKLAKELQIKEGHAVLRAERVLYTEQNKPVEHSILWFRSDAYRFTIDLHGESKLNLD